MSAIYAVNYQCGLWNAFLTAGHPSPGSWLPQCLSCVTSLSWNEVSCSSYCCGVFPNSMAYYFSILCLFVVLLFVYILFCVPADLCCLCISGASSLSKVSVWSSTRTAVIHPGISCGDGSVQRRVSHSELRLTPGSCLFSAPLAIIRLVLQERKVLSPPDKLKPEGDMTTDMHIHNISHTHEHTQMHTLNSTPQQHKQSQHLMLLCIVKTIWKTILINWFLLCSCSQWKQYWKQNFSPPSPLHNPLSPSLPPSLPPSLSVLACRVKVISERDFLWS